jgi:O-antigen/teichoic acid export membrane protein
MLGGTLPVTGVQETRISAARSVVWNYAGYLYQISINLGLTSYVVRYLAVPEYGLLLFVMSLSATLYLLDMGISSVLIQVYVAASASTEKNRFNDLLSTTFWALTVLGLIGVLIFTSLAVALPGPFNIPHEYLHQASIIFVVAALVIQVSLPTIALEQAYQACHRFDRINQIQLLVSTLHLALSMLVLAAGFRVVALALVQLAVAVIRLLILVIALPTSVPHARLHLARFKWPELKPLIHLSKWAFINNVSASLFDLAAWTILGTMGSMREAAMFGLATKLPTQLRNLVDKGAHVALPLWSQASEEGDRANLARTYLKVQKLVLGAVLPFVILGCIFARQLIQVWVGSQYAVAGMVMRWLLLAALAYAFAYASDLLLYACGQVKKAALIALWSGIVSAVSGLLLVSRYGAAGLAAGAAVTQLVINCTWLTAAACRICQISPFALLKAVVNGLAWPALVLLIEIVVIWSVASYLAPLWLVLAAMLSGCVYLALWGARTALPLYRSQGEIRG